MVGASDPGVDVKPIDTDQTSEFAQIQLLEQCSLTGMALERICHGGS
jgi:hypothetical protein